MVIGIQNALGSTLMTIADMSIITAEVKVDETDIVNVHLGQPAEVTIDAIPKKIFHGKVSEIGDNAIVRSSGVSTSQSTTASEEAKDFKVVVTLTDPPTDLRPGLSTTAKITTATRGNALAFPIQALTLRTKDQIEQQNNPPGSVHAAAPALKEAASKSKKEDDVQGVFVIRNKKAIFVPVTTGITGTTDIEVLDGLKEGDEVITGSYKVLRTSAARKQREDRQYGPQERRRRIITLAGLARPRGKPGRVSGNGAEVERLNPKIGEVSEQTTRRKQWQPPKSSACPPPRIWHRPNPA